MTRKVKIGGRVIGGGAPIAIQSMLNAPAADLSGNVTQAKALEAAGCEILRVAVPNLEAVTLVKALKRAISIPLVADIHFDYRIALECVAAGVDKIRLNPGNIGGEDRVRQVAQACKRAGVPIRIGVNSGSVQKQILEKYHGPTPEALVESALCHARLLEKCDFHDIVLSMKSSSVPGTIAAYRLAAEKTDYPLHLGVTEAGTSRMGLVKSAIGIGSLLCDGIGDTIRVSLTADPVEEIRAAQEILRACGKRPGVDIISCPTCGRTKIDLISLAEKVERALIGCEKPIKVAVMGCAVNGPGEAREADIGGGDGTVLLFKKGVPIAKYSEDQILEVLLQEIEQF